MPAPIRPATEEVTGISEGKSTLSLQPVSAGTGMRKYTVSYDSSSTVSTPSPLEISGLVRLAIVLTVNVRPEYESMEPPTLSVVLITNPVRGAPLYGLRTLLTVKVRTMLPLMSELLSPESVKKRLSLL